MKAIHQLIAYFEERGKIGRGQMEQLMAKGYWAPYTSADLRSLEKNVGHSYFFQVTGETHGPLWGTDVYTSDSNLGTAAVHAGLLRPGEAGVVKVTIVKPVHPFPGSTRNGVTSRDWTTSWPGAYQVELVKKG
jgi:hypothetical protein